VLATLCSSFCRCAFGKCLDGRFRVFLGGVRRFADHDEIIGHLLGLDLALARVGLSHHKVVLSELLGACDGLADIGGRCSGVHGKEQGEGECEVLHRSISLFSDNELAEKSPAAPPCEWAAVDHGLLALS
jgi:hypothetical protein